MGPPGLQFWSGARDLNPGPHGPELYAVSSMETGFERFELISAPRRAQIDRFRRPRSPGLLHELLHRTSSEVDDSTPLCGASGTGAQLSSGAVCGHIAARSPVALQYPEHLASVGFEVAGSSAPYRAALHGFVPRVRDAAWSPLRLLV